MSPEEVAEFVPVQNHVAAHVLEMREVQEGLRRLSLMFLMMRIFRHQRRPITPLGTAW